MKRFIAGATCPKCESTDSLFFNVKESEDRVYCTRCDYSALRPDQPSPENDQAQDESIKWH